jgi:hypothetical protein
VVKRRERERTVEGVPGMGAWVQRYLGGTFVSIHSSMVPEVPQKGGQVDCPILEGRSRQPQRQLTKSIPKLPL